MRFFDAYLAERGMPRIVGAITREHVESFVAHKAARHSASTASVRYLALQQFWKWLDEEGETPIVPERPVPVPDDDLIKKLLATC